MKSEEFKCFAPYLFASRHKINKLEEKDKVAFGRIL